MDLSKAFDTVNRKLLWTALYKKGIPLQMIQMIKEGRKHTALKAKCERQLSEPVATNIGAFQGAPLSALLFIIYLDDMMDDYQALNDAAKIPNRYVKTRSAKTERQIAAQKVRTQAELHKRIYHLNYTNFGARHEDYNTENEKRTRERNEGICEECIMLGAERSRGQSGMRIAKIRNQNETQRTRGLSSESNRPGLGSRSEAPENAEGNAHVCFGRCSRDSGGGVAADENPAMEDGAECKAGTCEDGICNYVIYADDTNLLIEREQETQTLEQKTSNYCRVAETRQLAIQWAKVALLTKTKKQNAPINKMPAPFNEIQEKQADRALGRKVNINGRSEEALKRRKCLAKGVWAQLKHKIYGVESLKHKTKIHLWNAIIKPILTHALIVEPMNDKQRSDLDNFTLSCTKHIQNPQKAKARRKDQPQKTQQEKDKEIETVVQFTQQRKQEKTSTWLDMLMIAHRLKQEGENMGTRENRGTKWAKAKWEKEWRNAHQEHTGETPKTPRKIREAKAEDKQAQATLKLLTTQTTPPNHMMYDMKELTRIIPKFHTLQEELQKRKQTTTKCMDCGEELQAGRKNNKKHREANPQRQAKWQARKHIITICPSDNCEETFTDEKKLHRHLTHHCHAKNIYKHIEDPYNKNRVYARNCGAPKEPEQREKSQITFGPDAGKWERNDCGKKETPYDRKSLILHTRTHAGKNETRRQKLDKKRFSNKKLERLNNHRIKILGNEPKPQPRQQQQQPQQPQQEEEDIFRDSSPQNNIREQEMQEQQQPPNPRKLADKIAPSKGLDGLFNINLGRIRMNETKDKLTRGICYSETQKTWEIHQWDSINKHVGAERKGIGKLPKYACPYCPKTFTIKLSLLKHVNMAKEAAGKKNWTAPRPRLPAKGGPDIWKDILEKHDAEETIDPHFQ